jgi:hypothetical protein
MRCRIVNIDALRRSDCETSYGSGVMESHAIGDWVYFDDLESQPVDWEKLSRYITYIFETETEGFCSEAYLDRASIVMAEALRKVFT